MRTCDPYSRKELTLKTDSRCWDSAHKDIKIYMNKYV